MQLDSAAFEFKEKLLYLSTPYTKYKDGQLWLAYKTAARIAGQLLKMGLNVYSPIAHSHPLAVYGQIDPKNHDLWMRVDAPFMAISDALIVVRMDGWRESVGMAHEIAAFKAAGKPLYSLDPVTLEITDFIEAEDKNREAVA